MILYFHEMTSPYICTFDIEHDAGKIFQFSGVIFKRVGEGLYQLCRNVNVYLKTEISPFISNFTHISQNFLDIYGVSEKEFLETFSAFVKDISYDDIIFLSHGAAQDLTILNNNNIPINGAHFMCTYTLAKKVLHRQEKLTLSDIAAECGFIIPAAHNAYDDAVTTAVILSFLLKKKGEQNNE